MVATFSSFTTTFFFLVTLIIIGIIFEKQFIALEDKFDAWVASKAKSNHKKTKPAKMSAAKAPAKIKKPASPDDSKYRGFAA